MASHGYKKYMKKEACSGGNPFVKIFVVSFFGMLLLFTLLFNYVSKFATVDTSIGDYKEQNVEDIEDKKIIDVSRLEMIQNEDQGRNFSDLMQQSTEESPRQENAYVETSEQTVSQISNNSDSLVEPVYKVFIGSYTSAEQAKVAKEIIQESGSGFNPIVKCIGANDYTLQVGIFKNKQSADAMLISIQNNNLPGRIVKE